VTKAVVAFPDTNTVLRYLLHDHEDMYREANTFFEAVRVGERHAVLLESVVAECVYVLTKFYTVPRAEAVAQLQAILRYRGIRNADADQLVEALGLYAERNVDLVDAILSVKAAAAHAEVFSFDRDLHRKLKRHVPPAPGGGCTTGA